MRWIDLKVKAGAEMMDHYYLETMPYIRIKEYQEEAARLRLARGAQQQYRENDLHRSVLDILHALRGIAFKAIPNPRLVASPPRR